MEENARISIERFADLQVGTMLAMGDEALGYAPRRLPIGSWSMMCHAVIGCESLGQALARHCRFYQLFEFGIHPTLEEDEDTARIRLERAGVSVENTPYLTEMILFNVHRFASWLVQEILPLQAVDLDYAPSAQASDYRDMFYGNPVQFEQTGCQLVMSRSLLEKRVAQNEASLRHFLRHPLLIMLTSDYARNSWTAQVREIVRHNLGDLPELKGIAARLDVHPQTLRRRLSAEGTTLMLSTSQFGDFPSR